MMEEDGSTRFLEKTCQNTEVADELTWTAWRRLVGRYLQDVSPPGRAKPGAEQRELHQRRLWVQVSLKP